MGYQVEESKNLIANTKYLGNEIHEDNRYAKEKFTLVDKEGNKITYELQSVKNGTGGRFDGYLIGGPANVEYENFDKLLVSAKKYFAEHPEERFTKLNQDISIASDYARVLAQEAAAEAFRNSAGRKVTNMEKLFLFQRSYIEQVNADVDNVKFLSWEQVIGKQDFGDDMVDASRQSIENDPMVEKFKHGPFSEEWEEAADRGEESLRERMKRDNRVAQEITMIRTGDGHQKMKVSTPKQQESETFNEDEVIALIRHSINRRRSNQ